MAEFIDLPYRAKDISGQRFDRLLAVGPVGMNRHKMILWLCRCDCGNESIVIGIMLRSGHTRSCGCFAADRRKEWNTTHGMTDTPLHIVWKGMKARCENPASVNFKHYGGRGISIYEEWSRSFEAFRDYVTQLPNYGEPGYTLDRIDNDQGYRPGNVQWATQAEQNRNTRRSNLIAYRGETKCLTDWAIHLSMKTETLRNRLSRGWDIERAFTRPVWKGREQK